jgi:lipid-binding SYLF domain-containing protein
MNMRILLAALAAMLLLGACTTTGGGRDADARRANIETGTDSALAELYRQVPGSRELIGRSRAVLVFPNVLQAGLGFGASRGDGALRINGKTASFHTTTSGSFGLQAGAQSTSVFLVFMTDSALRGFQNSSGWTVGADASVTLITVGANAQLTTATAQQPIVGFVLANRGLMAGVALDGTRIGRLNL